jgi:hypothetical protein
MTIKLLGIVDYYFSWHYEVAYYVLPEEPFEPCCGYVG